MIHLEIISSQDSMALGLYDFSFDQVFVGRAKKNDLIFEDKELPLDFLHFHIHQDKVGEVLMIKSLTQRPFFFHNGKKVHGSLRLRIGDVISFGKNEIKVIDFKKTQKNDDLQEHYSRFSKEAPELAFILDFIEEKILELETSGNQ